MRPPDLLKLQSPIIVRVNKNAARLPPVAIIALCFGRGLVIPAQSPLCRRAVVVCSRRPRYRAQILFQKFAVLQSDDPTRKSSAVLFHPDAVRRNGGTPRNYYQLIRASFCPSRILTLR